MKWITYRSTAEAPLLLQPFPRYEKFVHDINSNKSYDEWGEILKDHLIAAVLLDRILHHCTTLSIKGEKGGSMKW